MNVNDFVTLTIKMRGICIKSNSFDFEKPMELFCAMGGSSKLTTFHVNSFFKNFPFSLNIELF